MAKKTLALLFSYVGSVGGLARRTIPCFLVALCLCRDSV